MFKVSSDILSVFIIILLGFVSRNERIKMRLVGFIERLLSKNVQSNSTVDKNYSPNERILYQSFCKLYKYQYKAIQLNNMYRQRAISELSNKEKALLQKISYFEKFDIIDNVPIFENEKSITKLMSAEINSHPEIDIEEIKDDSSYVAPLSSITESLNHLVRDYNAEYFHNEVKPLVDYITREISSVSNLAEADIIVPGSGAGRIAYEISNKTPKFKVYSIELNSLMYALNSAIFKTEEVIKISPYLLDFSNHLDLAEQTKSFEIHTKDFQKPENLELICDNFLKFIPGNKGNDKTGIVVTAFFMDTAENILEYMEKIESLKKYYKEIHWINIGPLKYGTRPKVVLTSEEWTKLRKIRGWSDLHVDCNTKDEVGYLTNSNGLYKGRYSLLKFHATY
ncbi:uncharacterized protein HGUI_02955 [Hanseniaspora guilliermondii]|uniref:Uncharacterized protein n=1 Tax=Hanseniaspora guilliermondii TaxID=56406 RepID=A0A1L0B6Q5_9ASCO|nr:uncharacterized protein HGUI_02955 [Hanseniaspora guilliermondii]